MMSKKLNASGESCKNNAPALRLSQTPKGRVNALKNMQVEYAKLESSFYREVHALECKYENMYKDLFQKRAQIVCGAYAPTDEECDFPLSPDDDDKLFENEDDSCQRPNSSEKDFKGIPCFWLRAMKNVDVLADMIESHDEPILKHLIDVVVKLSESDPMGFTLEFHFEHNDYFTNSVLTKEYEMKCHVDEDDPFSFDGPEICSTKGCSIDWKRGKDPTVNTMLRVRKQGDVREVVKDVQLSFFDFFNPTALFTGVEEHDITAQSFLAVDFEIGHFIRERFIPRAVLYFTGDVFDDDDNNEEDPEFEVEDPDAECIDIDVDDDLEEV